MLTPRMERKTPAYQYMGTWVYFAISCGVNCVRMLGCWVQDAYSGVYIWFLCRTFTKAGQETAPDCSPVVEGGMDDD